MVVLAGCGGSPPSAAGSGPAFPGTPAGAQARWFVQELGRLPIPAAAIRAHFAPAFLAKGNLSPAAINAPLAGAVFGHSQGGIYALLLASGLAGHAPKVRAVGLLEPVPIRFLDVVGQSAIASLDRGVQNNQITAAQAYSLGQAITRAIATLRRTGTLPAHLPAGVAATFSRNATGTLLELYQIDRHDPAAVAARLPAYTAVLLTCSNADLYFGCAGEDHLAAGLTNASARLDYVHLNGVDHVLKEDITRNPATFGQSLPFSAQLRAALKTFLASNL